MKKKVIYVAGLVRSGTTFLELMLCQKYLLVGLGEVAQTIDGIKATADDLTKRPWLDISKRKCSCGQSISECDYWSDVNNKHSALDKKGLHQYLLDRSIELYGNRTIIDSSKDITAIRDYYENNSDVDLKIIYIVRDFRSWVESIRKYLRLNNMPDYGAVYQSYRWMKANKNNINYLSRFGDKVLLIQYEKLVFDSANQWRRMEEFIEEDVNVKTEVVHDVYGSRFKNTDTPLETVKYDSKWMVNNKYSLIYPFTFPVFAFNASLYSDTKNG
ncbi:MAG: sulfotransferase [Pseudomonadales bacterium]